VGVGCGRQATPGGNIIDKLPYIVTALRSDVSLPPPPSTPGWPQVLTALPQG